MKEYFKKLNYHADYKRIIVTIYSTTAAMTGPETSSQLTNDLKNEKEEFISMELLIGKR